MSTPAMHVVIVNYRTGALVVDCLKSLAVEVAATPGLRATVVDNASGDGSCGVIAAAIAAHGWGEWADLLPSPVNGGFACGNNLAVRVLLDRTDPPDLFWLLNPDTRVVPGAVRALSDFLRDHPEAGIAGSALIEGDGVLWPYAFRFPTILSETERGARLGAVSRLLAGRSVLRRMPPVAAPVDWVSGASMVVRRAVFESVGLMDESYFLYFEETDFCLQARKAGWQTWYVPHGSVVHIAGQSTGLIDGQPVAARVPRYWFESRRRYFVKNHGRAYAVLADIAWAVTHLMWRARRRIAARADDDPPALLTDFLRHSAIVGG
ncbi:glycosyltransferase family 2 protein [Sphingomonas sp. SUN019]|uniref:glycosyltransferase family 2 protein n=1 Tax=Sphingomonas sp. SUN019 TaxID=2937788 RepID=UPI002164DAB0|nr:glycosyltransferase family 2 protein [Sphingomonas sp. SUN019]UVO51485.1 glycosyltransferase family 2 protein [Sphingomonas sp. SUN019]